MWQIKCGMQVHVCGIHAIVIVMDSMCNATACRAQCMTIASACLPRRIHMRAQAQQREQLCCTFHSWQSQLHVFHVYFIAAHEADQPSNIWIFRLSGFPGQDSEWRGLCLLTWKFLWIFWVFPWKRVWYVRGLLWKLVGNGGSHYYFKSDLLRPWYGMTVWMSHNAFDVEEYVVQPIAARVAQNIEIFLKTFNLVPGVPGFPWDSSFVPFIRWY